jgi:hypothetical protein
MTMSNYQNGFAGGVSIRGMPVLNTYANNVFWVSSALGSDGNKGTRDKPFATLDYAFGKTTANKGDIIMVMPNHAETITGAGGIAHDVAGVSVIGMGSGNQRPRFLMDGGTTVSYAISAADAYVGNIVFASGHADVVTCFDVTAVYATIDGCEFVDNTTAENFKSCIQASGAANTGDGLAVVNCRFMTPDAATLAFVLLDDDIEFADISDNIIVSEGTGLATIFTCVTGKDVQRIVCMRNFLSSKATAGNLGYSNDTASPNNSGIIAHNRVRHADVTTTQVLGVVGGCGMFDNLSVSTDALSGFVLPAIDVNS